MIECNKSYTNELTKFLCIFLNKLIELNISEPDFLDFHTNEDYNIDYYKRHYLEYEYDRITYIEVHIVLEKNNIYRYRIIDKREKGDFIGFEYCRTFIEEIDNKLKEFLLKEFSIKGAKYEKIRIYNRD